MLVLILISKLTVFSQVDIQDSTGTKCFPVPLVKTIIKDLMSGDSAKAQLVVTEQELSLNEKKIELKDTIIFTMREKERDYKQIIRTQDDKYATLFDYTRTLQENVNKLTIQNNHLKRVNKVQGIIIGSGFTIALGYAAVWYFLIK